MGKGLLDGSFSLFIPESMNWDFVWQYTVGRDKKACFTQFYRWKVFIFVPDLYNISQAGGLNNESN